MPGTILSLLTPWRLNTILFGVFDYLVPIMLYCGWSTVAFLDLADRAEQEPAVASKWAAAVLLVPAAGAAAYLLVGRSRLTRSARLATVGGGLLVVALAAILTVLRTR
jgi:hypothetical protein